MDRITDADIDRAIGWYADDADLPKGWSVVRGGAYGKTRIELTNPHDTSIHTINSMLTKREAWDFLRTYGDMTTTRRTAWRTELSDAVKTVKAGKVKRVNIPSNSMRLFVIVTPKTIQLKMWIKDGDAKPSIVVRASIDDMERILTVITR